MASRMDRYHSHDTETKKRSRRNESLYDSIYNDNIEYSNVEGIARIEKTNEIDINRIREMLREEEEKKRKKTSEPVFKRTIPLPQISEKEDTKDERNYDIRDILVKAKKDKSDEEKNQYRNLKNTQYNILKNIKLDDQIGKKEKDEESQELKELIHTITNHKALEQINDRDLSLDLLDDLKSDHTNTSTLNKESIQKILQEAKEKQKEEEPEEVRELDKSFYTSSLNFDDEDFEELRELSSKYRRNNILIKVLIAIVAVAIIIMIVLFFMKMPK